MGGVGAQRVVAGQGGGAGAEDEVLRGQGLRLSLGRGRSGDGENEPSGGERHDPGGEAVLPGTQDGAEDAGVVLVAGRAGPAEGHGRTARDRLWVTDITEHPTREGKIYCAVVLDVYSRRAVG